MLRQKYLMLGVTLASPILSISIFGRCEVSSFLCTSLIIFYYIWLQNVIDHEIEPVRNKVSLLSKFNTYRPLPSPYRSLDILTQKNSDQSKSGIFLIGLGLVCDIEVHMF